ncbi:fumarylacetoacetate hydrolase family protein [Nocardioides sp. YIM 152588]|uniref:fumarylacetoacetate hydrolase family protein n=1 Tax=Nocardioides sp. YIM 152588 TaxID=3158259 RepID=UPI0032E3E2AD
MTGFGVYLDHGGVRRVGWRAGEHVLDLGTLARADRPALGPFLACGSLDALLTAGPAVWADALEAALAWEEAGADRVPLDDARPVLGFTVADYVDFYASEHHAAHVGRLFRPGQPPLPANWKHLPIGYHGRAGTVVVSGTPITRPSGQVRCPDGTIAFGPSARLDLEAEVGFVVGVPADRPVPLGRFADHVFGVCLVNDWSARDIQAWEYVPLGPFLGKSFATSVSPWVVPLALLDAARVAPPPRDPRPLAYLDDTDAEPWGLDLQLEVLVNGAVVAAPPAASLYWTGAQQLAHLTVNGATLRCGDLFASGTVSGPAPDQAGSLLELTENGTEPLTLPDGSVRGFLEDGDEVVVRATAPGVGGTEVDLGEVAGRITPAVGPALS